MQPEQDPNLQPAPPPTPPLRTMEPVKPTYSARPATIPPAPPQYSYQPPRRRVSRFGRFRSIASTFLLFLLAPLIALFIAAFVVQSYQVEGQSMQPTLQDNDRLIVDKWHRSWARITKHNYIPHRGDIIIFNQSGIGYAGAASKQLIKRVIGLPGERVVVKDGKVTVYNSQFQNGFNPDALGLYLPSTPITAGNVDIRLLDDEIFVLGDNRANSEDSRYFGPVNVEQIVGKLVLRIVPLDKAKRF